MTKLVDDIWWTRRTRIQTEKRLRKNASFAQHLLIWYAFCGVAAAIWSLTNETRSNSEVWIMLSVLTLSISGYINGLNLTERADRIKSCYISLHDLYVEAITSSNEPFIRSKYKKILDNNENHITDDYCVALCQEYLSCRGKKEENGLKVGMSAAPTSYHWLIYLKTIATNVVLAAAFYSLPLLALYSNKIWQQ